MVDGGGKWLGGDKLKTMALSSWLRATTAKTQRQKNTAQSQPHRQQRLPGRQLMGAASRPLKKALKKAQVWRTARRMPLLRMQEVLAVCFGRKTTYLRPAQRRPQKKKLPARKRWRRFLPRAKNKQTRQKAAVLSTTSSTCLCAASPNWLYDTPPMSRLMGLPPPDDQPSPY